MKSLITICFVSLFFFFSCKRNNENITTDIVKNPLTASSETDSMNMPEMFFPESVFNFGTITQGEKVAHSFLFQNKGNASLVITTAKGSCGCTVPQCPQKPIPPGGEDYIEVIFDSNHKSGQQYRQITIVANTQPSTTVIALKGEVIAPNNTNN